MALKISAERMALCASQGPDIQGRKLRDSEHEHSRDMAKYFCKSLAMEKVVSDPRVMSSCFPISMTSISFAGRYPDPPFFPASLAAWVPEFMAIPISAAPGPCVVRAVAHQWRSTFPPVVPCEYSSSCLPFGFRQYSHRHRLFGDGGCRQGIVSRPHATRSPMARRRSNDHECRV